MVLTHNDLRITENTFHLKRLPPEWEGLRVVQLSDLHFYEYSDPEFYGRVTKHVNDLAPDLIVITGDVVHYGDKHLDKALHFLSNIHAKIGKYAILGNHDYYDQHQGKALTKTMQDAGYHVLINESVCLERNGVPFWVAGLDDLWCGQPDLDQTLSQIPDNEFVFMLGHNPLLFDPVFYYEKKSVDVLVAGHTHAGHVYFPILGPIYRHVFKMKYRYHHHHKPHEKDIKTQLYVSSGVGSAAFYFKGKKRQFGFPRFRFNTNPEIVLHTFNQET